MSRKSSSECYLSDQSFTLFSQLPFELRDQIWKLALVDDPRIVYLKQYSIPASVTPHSIKASRRFQNKLICLPFGSHSISTSILEPHPQTMVYKSRCPPPALLYTCSESRKLAQNLFALAFGSSSCSPMTYFSFSNDILYLSYSFLRAAVEEPSSAFYTNLKADIQNVKHLMIGGVWEPFSQTPWTSDFIICLIKVLAAFGGLETVALINGRHREDDPELLVLNIRCPYECWELHKDERKTACLRERDPDWESLLRYGDNMHVQEPPGLSGWPTFYFRTVVPKGARPEGFANDEEKAWRRWWSAATKFLTGML